MTDIKSIHEGITYLLNSDPENKTPKGDIIYEEPLIGCVDANNPLFEKMKDESIIGPIFRSPGEWLPGAVTVISYFLPFSQAIKKGNYIIDTPSEAWMHARFRGESINNKTRTLIISLLKNNGGRAVAPILEPEFEGDDERGTSNWSERHIAYAAGLGSFSLSRGLITKKGVAGRYGSVITDLHLPLSEGPEGPYFKNCPYLIDKSCGACIDRCPAGAISANGMDKTACNNQINTMDQFSGAIREKYGYPYSACGKCQVDVPCESKIPD